jgi:hypothetical protein
MTLLRSYEPARTCTGGPTPGAKALMAVYLGLYKQRGGTNLGIYNCRTVRGAFTTSLHGEGRACDFGINPHGAPWGTELAERLRVHSAELGIQCVIWNRRIWSGAYPDAGFRAYSGTNPHLDHIHVELTRAAANTLTEQRAHQILTGFKAQEDDLPTPADVWDYKIADPFVPPTDPAHLKPARDLVGWSATHAAYARGLAQDAVKAVAALQLRLDRLTAAPAGGVAVTAGLSDEDVQRIAAAVIDLLSKRTAS